MTIILKSILLLVVGFVDVEATFGQDTDSTQTEVPWPTKRIPMVLDGGGAHHFVDVTSTYGGTRNKPIPFDVTLHADSDGAIRVLSCIHSGKIGRPRGGPCDKTQIVDKLLVGSRQIQALCIVHKVGHSIRRENEVWLWNCHTKDHGKTHQG